MHSSISRMITQTIFHSQDLHTLMNRMHKNSEHKNPTSIISFTFFIATPGL